MDNKNRTSKTGGLKHRVLGVGNKKLAHPFGSREKPTPMEIVSRQNGGKAT
jgi:hypothetical protein